MSNAYAATPPNAMRSDALAGVRTRRILAICIDFVLVSLLVAAIWFASIVLTLGLALFFLHLTLWPIVAFFYSCLTITARHTATPGTLPLAFNRRLLETGARVPFTNATYQSELS